MTKSIALCVMAGFFIKINDDSFLFFTDKAFLYRKKQMVKATDKQVYLEVM